MDAISWLMYKAAQSDYIRGNLSISHLLFAEADNIKELAEMLKCKVGAYVLPTWAYHWVLQTRIL